jgi:hypothetical protein
VTRVAATDTSVALGWTERFGATEYGTLPGPWPLVGPVNRSQSPDALTDHGHSRAVLTLSVPVPPEPPIVGGSNASSTLQRVSVGPSTEVSAEPQPAHSVAHTAMQNERKEGIVCLTGTRKSNVARGVPVLCLEEGPRLSPIATERQFQGIF